MVPRSSSPGGEDAFKFNSIKLFNVNNLYRETYTLDKIEADKEKNLRKRNDDSNEIIKQWNNHFKYSRPKQMGFFFAITKNNLSSVNRTKITSYISSYTDEFLILQLSSFFNQNFAFQYFTSLSSAWWRCVCWGIW